MGCPFRAEDDVASLINNANNATIHRHCAISPTATGWGKEFGGRPTAVWEEKAR